MANTAVITICDEKPHLICSERMRIEVEVISRETIKPCSPTPDHLRHYPLSFLDQISPPVYMPMVLFYERDVDNCFSNIDRSNRLKKSLSEVLTHFYPLAGRVKDNLFVDCNDEGIHYVEARVNCQLSEFIQEPVPAENNKFLPYELDDVADLVLGIQVNIFDCGGMAIGLCSSHKVADALSFFMFIKSWAATARGKSDIVCPQFESATLFPPRNLLGFKPNTGITKESLVTKRFVFNASMIAALRAKYASVEDQKRPTRVEALSAFIWSRFVAVTQADRESEGERIYTVLHAVNLRTRMDPPLPEYTFGNLYRVAIATASVDSGGEGRGLVSQMRDSIKKINGDYIAKLQEGDEHLNFIKERAERFRMGEVVSMNFTSLCGFPLYEADFGWGKPIWIGSARLTFKNLVSLIDRRSGDGMEAWLNMKEEDMAKLEGDKEFLAFVSPTSKHMGT